MKVRNLDEILDEIGDFERTKSDIFLEVVSLHISVTG